MNENNLKNKGSFIIKVILGVVLILVIFGGIYLSTQKKVDAPTIEENNLEILGNKEDLVSFSVKPGDTVSGILNLSGSVRNAYFFEGETVVSLLDSKMNIIKVGNGTATSDWMTVEPVSFTSTIDSSELNGNGYISIKFNEQANPEEVNYRKTKEILIPVIFNNDNQETMTVKLYFGNSIFNPESFDCSLVYPIERLIPYTQSVATATLNELIKGPTASEKAKGYFGVINEETKIDSIKIENGILYVDFNKEVEYGGGSCLQSSRISSIIKTLKQFEIVKEVKLSVEGVSDPSLIFQP